MGTGSYDPANVKDVEKMLTERGNASPEPHPSKLIDELIKNDLAPLMKTSGFRKSGPNFWRDKGIAIDVLNIQKSQWNNASEASFYVNLGVYWKPYHQDRRTEFKSRFPHEYDCTVFSRVPEPSVKSWTLFPDSDLRQVGTDLVNAVLQFAFAWFKEMQSEANVLAHLKRQRIAENFENWLNSRNS